MNKTKNIVWIISIVILCVLTFVFYNMQSKEKTEQQSMPVFSDEFVKHSASFSDGLTNPDSVTNYPLDEFGTGLSEKSVYYIDINQDKKPDRITKTLTETGNAHSFYEYKIELNVNEKFIDITPKNFRTINGDMCDLQQIQFIFKPKFKVVLISRELGNMWEEPTVAEKKVFNISDDKFKTVSTEKMRKVCDVKELF